MRTRRRLSLLAALAIVAAAALALLAGCGASAASTAPAISFAGGPVERGGMRLPARVQGDHIALAVGDRFEERFWPGVNLGSTIPGHQPGEVAATAED